MVCTFSQCQIENDLSLNIPYIQGQKNQVKNCWHCCSDGRTVDIIFTSDEDFRDGMNRIYFVGAKYQVIILAFALMGTHVHFILYGSKEACIKFMHEYVRRTSQYINEKHKKNKALKNVQVSCQEITDDVYLKVAICYVLRNPFVAGLPYFPIDYPWSSACLYFRTADLWMQPSISKIEKTVSFTYDQFEQIFKSHPVTNRQVKMIGNMISPLEYVRYDIVEKLFKTPRAYFYFLSQAKEDEFERKIGEYSKLSMTIQEMRQNRMEMSQMLFGTKELRGLNVEQRLHLARNLKRKYHSSAEQILRSCGLKISECKDLL